MDKKVIMSEKKDKTETKETDNSNQINGNGLLELIHDTIGRITDVIQSIKEENEDSEKDSKEDVVEFAKDVEDKEDDDNIVTETTKKQPGIPQSLLLDLANKPDITTPFELLENDDFDLADPVVEHFNNDMGGCGGMVKIIRLDGPEAISKLSSVYQTLKDIRIAHKTKTLNEVFEHVNAVANGKGGQHQILAIQKIDTLMNDASVQERFALQKSKEAILEGTAAHFDAAGFRVRGILSQYAPEQNIRTAYTNLETQNGDLIMLPQGKHQLGRPTTLELSKFRDHSVDAKVDPLTGEVHNGYLDFEARRDNTESVRERFETIRHPDNEENLLTLAKGERSKPLTKNERNYEQRLDEDTKNRYNFKTWEKSREEALDDAKESNLGHHGEPEEDESIARTLSKTAAKKFDKVDPDSDDTMGEQISAVHKPIKDETLEEMLDDERVGLTEEELDMLLEEWLETARTNE